MEKELREKLAKINAEAEEIRLQIEKSEKERMEKAKEEELNKNGEASKNCGCQNEVSHAVNAMQEILVEIREQMKSLDNQVQKITRDSAMANYETQAIVIENLQKWKNEMKEREDAMRKLMLETESRLMKRMEQIHREIEERLGNVEEGQQNVVELIKGMQGNIEKILTSSSKEQFVQQEVCTETILVLGATGENGSKKLLVLKENKWTALSLKLPTSVCTGGAVYLNGEIYIFGGFSMEKELYKLDNKTLEWRKQADMNEPRRGITNSCLEWKGSIWVFGGINGLIGLKSVERYDPKVNRWTRMPDMEYPRFDAATSVHNGKFIICGGIGGSHLSTVECFDPESGIWTELNDMPIRRCDHSLVFFENRLILMGGSEGQTHVNTVWELTEEGTWKELPSMKRSRHGFGVAILDKEIYVIGGNGQLRGVEIFNGETWRDGPPLPYDCSNMSSLVIPKHLADTLCTHTV